MNKDVFISHSSADQAQVEEIRRYLERYGFRCWISYKDLSPGENFMEKCREAINTCPIFLLILSENSINSTQVVQEIGVANAATKNGLRLYSITLNPYLNISELPGAFGYVFAGVQTCWWHKLSDRKTLVRRMAETLGKEINPSTGRIDDYPVETFEEEIT